MSSPGCARHHGLVTDAIKPDVAEAAQPFLCALAVIVSFVSMFNAESRSNPSLTAMVFSGRAILETVECLASINCELIIYKVSTLDSARFGLTVVIVRLKDHPSTFKVRDVRDSGALSQIFARIAGSEDAVLVNGGFFGDDQRARPRPIGLVIADDVRVSALQRSRIGGVLVKFEMQHEIIPIRLFEETKRYANALQSWPILVQSGRLGIRSDDQRLFDRVAIALTHSGSVVAVGAFNDNGQAVSLYEFAELMLHASKLHGLGIIDALNLDGGPSAHIYLPRLRRHFGAASRTYLPNAVAIGVQ